jgi:hypothetical protein
MRRLGPLAMLAILGGFVVHVAVFYVLRVEVPSPPTAPLETFRVQYLGDPGLDADPILRDQALLHDSAPLFMPTKWNLASQMADVASLQQATAVFDRFPPVLSLNDTPPSLQEEGVDPNLSLTSLIPGSGMFVLSRLGREPVEELPGPDSGSTVQAYRLDRWSGEGARHSASLPPALLSEAPKALWTPVRLYLHIARGKPFGIPRIEASSGFSDWDQALKEHVGSLQFYRNLGNGYFLVVVYP